MVTPGKKGVFLPTFVLVEAVSRLDIALESLEEEEVAEVGE